MHDDKNYLTIKVSFFNIFQLTSVRKGNSHWMNMQVKSAEFECRVLRNGLRQPLIRVYMDDVIVTATSVFDAGGYYKV